MSEATGQGRWIAPVPVRGKPNRVDGGYRALMGLAGLVTFGGGTWSIGGMLMLHGAPQSVAILGAVAYDMIAAIAMLRTVQLHATPHKAMGAQLTMLGAVLVSLVVNAAHGFEIGGWMTAVIFAAFPIAFESAWLLRHGVMPLVVRRVFPEHVKAMRRADVWDALNATVDAPFVSVLAPIAPGQTEVKRSESTDAPVRSKRSVPTMRRFAAPEAKRVEAMRSEATTSSPTSDASLAPVHEPVRSEAKRVVGFASTGARIAPERVEAKRSESTEATVRGEAKRVDAPKRGEIATAARELVSAGASRDELTATLRGMFPRSSPDSIRSAINRAGG